MKNIRNFLIMAHIDHGKSTLADRMIEITNTVEKRKMKDQVLDSMELERERGITIKMQPVRMLYEKEGTQYTLNLIDTPGHIDFSYEVSRALQAVEGALLLVDATQGVQAQTLTTLSMAQELNLVIIPVITKVDSPLARVDDVRLELLQLLGCSDDSIFEVSGRTGQGVEELLGEIIKSIPSPNDTTEKDCIRALIFDFEYSNHRGVIVYIRIFDGKIKKGDSLFFTKAKSNFQAGEVGVFQPAPKAVDSLCGGEVGYIVTGIKEPGIASVGDTITGFKKPQTALPGYHDPQPVVWASVYPESADNFILLRQALSRIKLSDPSISFEEEASGVLGRGFRCGFLGMLHLEIIMERLRREFDLELIMTIPSTIYEIIHTNNKKEVIYSPVLFPDYGQVGTIREPWVSAKIITPGEYIGGIMQILYDHEADVGASSLFGDNRTEISFTMPIRELMRNFFDEIKSISSGFASLSYEIAGMKEADVVRLDILVADEVIPAFSKVVSRRKVEKEAQEMVEHLHKLLPRQMFVAKIQGKSMGRILASRTLAAFRKDVTSKLYGGDITRKRKLLEKQKKGKKKMKEKGKINIPHSVFLKIVKKDS